MEKSNIIGWAALHAAVATGYILLVVNLIQIIAPKDPETPFGAAGFLLLFCLSAAIMASLVFGRPVLWYLDGRKKDAVTLLLWIIFFLFVATVLVLCLSNVIWLGNPRVL